MSKKKKSVELSSKKIEFTKDDIRYKVIRYYPTQMSLDVLAFEGEEKLGMQNIPFAHLPKEIKKLVKPN